MKPVNTRSRLFVQLLTLGLNKKYNKLLKSIDCPLEASTKPDSFPKNLLIKFLPLLVDQTPDHIPPGHPND